MKIQSLIDLLRRFFLVELWLTREGERRSLRWSKRFLSVVVISAREFMNNNVSNRASALTYSTLLSCVPILAVLFAISKGFGVDKMLEESLYEAFSTQKEVAVYLIDFVNSYLTQTHKGLFLGVGIVTLLITVVNLTSKIEQAFNDIWGVRKGRTIYRKVTDYFSFFLLLPIFIVASGGLSIFIGTMLKDVEGYLLLGDTIRLLIHLTPFFMSWLMFTGLYMFMPNTKVRFGPAFIAGVVAGTGYQLFQMLYISGQMGLSKYNAVYGSFAALPLLLMWLQISWTIILYGAELSYAIQNMRNFAFLDHSEKMSRRGKDFCALLILRLICKRFYAEVSPLSATQIATQTHLPIRLAQKTLNRLVGVKLIHVATSEEVSGEEMYYQPSVDVHALTVERALQRIYTCGTEDMDFHPPHKEDALWKALTASDNAQILLIDLPDE